MQTDAPKKSKRTQTDTPRSQNERKRTGTHIKTDANAIYAPFSSAFWIVLNIYLYYIILYYIIYLIEISQIQTPSHRIHF